MTEGQHTPTARAFCRRLMRYERPYWRVCVEDRSYIIRALMGAGHNGAGPSRSYRRLAAQLAARPIGQTTERVNDERVSSVRW